MGEITIPWEENLKFNSWFQCFPQIDSLTAAGRGPRNTPCVLDSFTCNSSSSTAREPHVVEACWPSLLKTMEITKMLNDTAPTRCTYKLRNNTTNRPSLDRRDCVTSSAFAAKDVSLFFFWRACVIVRRDMWKGAEGWEREKGSPLQNWKFNMWWAYSYCGAGRHQSINVWKTLDLLDSV